MPLQIIPAPPGLASATHTGLVSTTTQVFGGAKTFNTTITIDDGGTNLIHLGGAVGLNNTLWLQVVPTSANYTLVGFSGDTYLNAPSGFIRFCQNNGEKGRIGTAGFYGPANFAFFANGDQPDGASALGTVLDTTHAFTTAGAKLLSLRNLGTEKAFVDKDGQLTTPQVNFTASEHIESDNFGTLVLAAASTVTATGHLNAFSTVIAGSVVNNGILLNPGGSGPATIDVTLPTADTQSYLILKSESIDGSTAQGIVINTAHAFTTSGARLLSVQNNSVEKANVDKDGNITAGDLNVGTVNCGPIASNGTTWANSQSSGFSITSNATADLFTAFTFKALQTYGSAIFLKVDNNATTVFSIDAAGNLINTGTVTAASDIVTTGGILSTTVGVVNPGPGSLGLASTQTDTVGLVGLLVDIERQGGGSFTSDIYTVQVSGSSLASNIVWGLDRHGAMFQPVAVTSTATPTVVTPAGSASITSGSTITITLNGITGNDLVFTQIAVLGTGPTQVSTAVCSTNTITITLDAPTTGTTTVNWFVLRKTI